MKRPINFHRRISEPHVFKMGNGEEFKFEELKLSIIHNNNRWYQYNTHPYNMDCIWLRPAEGWNASNFLGDYVLMIKINWENQTGAIVKSVVGNGVDTVPNCEVRFRFYVNDVKDLDSFSRFIENTITNNSHIIKS